MKGGILMKEVTKDKEKWFGPEDGLIINFIAFGLLILTVIIALYLERYETLL